MKSVRARDGSDEPPSPGRNGDADFHGARRKNDTHASTTDAQAKFFRKGTGKEAKLCFMGHVLTENRPGLIVKAHVSQASGTAERDAALDMIEAHSPGSTRRLTLAGDKGYDAADFVGNLRRMHVTPHIAQHQYVTKTGKIRALEHRPAHDAPSRLWCVAACAQAHRGGVRLGQDDRRARQDEVSRD